MISGQSMLRILQINTADLGGGAEGSAWNLFQSYRTRGHNSWLAVGCKRSNDPDVLLVPNDAYRSQWVRTLVDSNPLLKPLMSKMSGVSYLCKIREPRRWFAQRRGWEDFDFPGTWQLLQLTPEFPDILHCHNLHGGYFDLRALPWLSQQLPVILNLRDAWLLSGHCAHSFDCQRWKFGCGQCPDLTIYPAIRRDATVYNWQRKRHIFKKSRLYISTPSQWLMDKVQASVLHGVQYRVIPNAIDLKVFQPGNQTQARRALDLPESAKIILLIAHNEFKDYDMMEAALGQLKRVENSELLFICLGKSGPDRVIGEGLMVYCGVEHSQERMALFYQASDVFIHAAKDEAFGKTITEAMACGVPVVATAVGGILEQIENGKTGFLVSPGEVKQMAQRVNQLLEDKVLREYLSQRALKLAREKFDLNSQVEIYLNWYREILDGWERSITR